MTNPPSHFTIIQHNVRNWGTNKHAFANIYNNFNPDIILLNGTSTTDGQTIKIFNYNVFKSNKANAVHNGTAIAIRRDLQPRLDDDYYTDLLAVTIDTAQGKITIATNYIPPRDGYINYIDFHRLFRQPHPIIFIGDMNANHRHLGHNSTNYVGRQLKTIMNKYDLTHNGPDFPTFIGHNGIGKPDIVLTNKNFHYNLHLRPGPLTPSDHIPIIATISTSLIHIPMTPRYQIHRTNWEQYRQLLQNIRINPRIDCNKDQIDDYIETWTTAIQDAFNKTTPTLYKRTIPGVRPDRTTKRLQTDYQQLLTDIRTYGPSQEKYRKLNRLQNDISKAYKDIATATWEGLISQLDIETDPQKFWKTLKRLQGTNKQTAPYLKDRDGQKIYTNEDKERLFREHWDSIFTDDGLLDNDFTDNITDYVCANDRILRPHAIANLNRLNEDFPPITMTELTTALKTFKDKSPGPTNIRLRQLLNLPDNMTKALLPIFNITLSIGYFPDTFKKATMIFIPKSTSNQTDVTKFRPISLLDIQGKILDKILNQRLTHRLETTGMTNDRQHGFRRNRGTHTALATLNETLARDLRRGHSIDIVMRDVTKAFDKVWHDGLKFKIEQLRLPNDCFTKILCNYLDNRTAKIRLGTFTGHDFTLNTGVPQGACLSPTLYSFYIHDLPEPIPQTDYIAFADDITQIISSNRTPKFLAKLTERAIEQISNFEKHWKIQTHTGKFTIVNIARKNTAIVHNQDQTIIPYSKEGKVLGLTINQGGFAPQTYQRRAIALSRLNKLNRFRKLSQPAKLRLYTSTVRSALLYPTIPLHTLSKPQISRLQKVQNAATRFITGHTRIEAISSQTLHHMSNLTPINTYLHQLANSTWTKIKSTNPQLFNKFPHQPDATYNSRRNFPSSKRLALQPPPAPLYL